MTAAMHTAGQAVAATAAWRATLPRPRASATWLNRPGAKTRISSHVLAHLPTTPAGYTEPYAGSAAILLRREPVALEVVNDLDGDLVGLYRVLQDPGGYALLAHRVACTPHALAEYERALAILRSDGDDPVERAWAYWAASAMGFGGQIGAGFGRATGWYSARSTVDASRTQPASLAGKRAALEHVRARLLNVTVESICALDLVDRYDTPDTLHYLDPPYVTTSRASAGRLYAHEQDDGHHRDLVDLLLRVRGMAVLSGYPSDVYDPLVEAGWRTVDKAAAASLAGRTRRSGIQGAGAASESGRRTERLWISPRALERLRAEGRCPPGLA